MVVSSREGANGLLVTGKLAHLLEYRLVKVYRVQGTLRYMYIQTVYPM